MLGKKAIMGLLRCLFFIVLLGGVCPQNARGYVMPAEQVIGLMAKNFSGVKTVLITQAKYLEKPEDQVEETPSEEKWWLKSPDLFRFEASGTSGLPAEDSMTPFRLNYQAAARRLLMAAGERAMISLLSKLEVNLESVGLTRLNGVVAYRLGEKGPEDPKLLVEKERFLPILLCFACGNIRDGGGNRAVPGL